MRMALKELMDKLGVGRVLSPYETHPWFHYDAEKGVSCSAEVRMGPRSDDVEAEIQFLLDNPAEDDKTGGREQIAWLRIEPAAANEWTTKAMRVRAEDYHNKIHNWEEKGCNFFRAFIEALQMGVLPDVDELIEKELDDDNFGGGGKRGRVGRKSPGIKPGALLGMKKM